MLTLITIYNGRAAIGLGMFLAVVMMVLSLLLDLPGYDRHGMREDDWSMWSSWSGFLVTALVMIFWRPQTRVFLDSTCISQCNDELKAKGISVAEWLRFTLLGIMFDSSAESLNFVGAYELSNQGIVSLAGLLRRSDSMLILWDPTWTET